MKSILLRVYYLAQKIRRNFLKNLKQPNFSCTFFEGGLGSQLLAYIEYENKKRIFGSQANSDTSYFIEDRVFEHESGLVHWRWRLDHYGITLQRINAEKPAVQGKNSRRRPTVQERQKFCLSNRIFGVTSEILYQLPVKSTPLERNKIFFAGLEASEYGVVHIRKGDYLKVASRVIKVSEVIRTLEILKNDLPPTLIFVSDGEISELEKNQVKEAIDGGKKTISVNYFDSTYPVIDETLVHDLMRCAQLLITSNSTFSLSAGLLNVRPDKRVLIPVSFFGESDQEINEIFRNLATFAILDEERPSIVV